MFTAKLIANSMVHPAGKNNNFLSAKWAFWSAPSCLCWDEKLFYATLTFFFDIKKFFVQHELAFVHSRLLFLQHQTFCFNTKLFFVQYLTFVFDIV